MTRPKVRQPRKKKFFGFLQTPFYRSLTITFSLIIAIAIIMNWIGFQSKNQLQQSIALEQRARAILEQSEQVESLLVDMETGQRGYVATQNPLFLDPYRAAIAQFNTEFERLEQLASYDRTQQARVAQIKQLSIDKRSEVAAIIEAEQAGDHQSAIDRMATARGKQIMDSIRMINTQIKNQEERDLAIRNERSALFSKIVDLSSLGGLLIIALVVAICLNETVRTFEKNVKLQKQLDAAYRRLKIDIGTAINEIDNDTNISAELQEVSDKFKRILENSSSN